MQPYIDLLKRILVEGEDVATGAYLPDEDRHPRARCLVGVQYRHDLRDSFPAVTTKRLFWKGVIAELLWFLRGETTLDFLHQHDVHIWDQWRNKDNEIARSYPEQWRCWEYLDTVMPPDGKPGITVVRFWDQIDEVVKGLKAVSVDHSNRARRRLVVSAWNAPIVPQMGLAPCHTLWQALPTNGVLHMVCHWRSIDMLFGFPFNIASYALLTHVLAEATGLQPGVLVANIADCHVYDNQFDAVREQVAREPMPPPRLFVSDDAHAVITRDLSAKACRELSPSQFFLINYRHRGKLSCEPEIAQ